MKMLIYQTFAVISKMFDNLPYLREIFSLHNVKHDIICLLFRLHLI